MNETVLYRYIQGEATAEERLRVAEWLKENPKAHLQMLNEVRFVYEIALMHHDVADQAIVGNQNIRPNPPHGLVWKRLAHYTIRIAAAIMLVIAGGYVTKYKIYDSINSQSTVVQVPYGQRIQITLSDGTSIWLNSGARLEYPVLFSQKCRKVKLTGEALFEVQHNSDRPFQVETFASNISVLGTTFNVNADKLTNSFSTTLLQGKVKISNRLNPEQEEIIMKPNDIVNLSNGRLLVEAAKDPEVLCWTEGLVNLTGLTFNELMIKFEQAFDVKIVISRDTAPRIGKISGKVRVNDGIENALHILQYAADFTYVKDIETNVITIY